MFNNIELSIETRLPYTFKLTKNNYDTILEEYRSYSREYSHKNILKKLIDRVTNKTIDIEYLSTTCNILFSELDNHFRGFNNNSIILDNREISAAFEMKIDHITEMSIEIILNISNNDTGLYHELYRYSEDLYSKSNITLKPMECLIVKPASYIKTVSNNNELLVFHISPMYDSQGIFADPIYDSVFIADKPIDAI